MFSTLYFPMVAAMSTPHAAHSDDIADRFMKAVTDGKLRLAQSLVSRWAEEHGTDDEGAYPVQLYGDLRLMARAEVDADEAYRRSQKLIRASKQALRVASCRNAGWQALFRNRLGTALACFARLADERGITAERAAEARFAIVCILQELGKTAQVSVALDGLREQIGDIDGETRQRWQELIDTLEFELAVQADIRTAAPLQDHVFWQSSVGDGVTCASAKPANYLEDLLAKISRVRSPLLRIRIDALRQQRAAACGDRAAFSKLLDHLQWARKENVPDYQRTASIEVALVALAAAAPRLAETVLEPLHHITQTMTEHRQLEYLYCMSKTRQSQGRAQEATRLYCRYALVAMQCLRADSHLRAPIIDRTAKPAPQLDDVGVRLPAKYRRAYQYALDNLDRQDLSVREIAAEIGVTERALQSAFRELLGLTPTELIRQQRMERIRAELVDGAFTGERGVLDAASRWGVGNRSTLINSYRKQFDEAPSETLGR